MPTTKPTIALDCDEVLFPFAEAYLQWRQQNNLTVLSLEQLTGYHWHEILQVDPTTANEEEARFLADVGTSLHPLVGAKEGVIDLAKRYSIVVITARVASVHGNLTQIWLDHHFPNLISEVIFTHTDPVTNIGSKAEMVERVNAAVLVDDYAGHLRNLGPNRRGVLFGSHPWTLAAEVPQGAVHVPEWRPLPQEITRLATTTDEALDQPVGVVKIQ